MALASIRKKVGQLSNDFIITPQCEEAEVITRQRISHVNYISIQLYKIIIEDRNASKYFQNIYSNSYSVHKGIISALISGVMI